MTQDDVRALSPGATLLHIGAPKTGTTAVQAAAARLRDELLAQGVCYPGAALNHGRASNALMGRSTAVFEAGGRARWDRIARELRAHPDAIGWISYEQIVQATPDVATRFLDELGPDLHVAITARAYVPMFASAWQQWVKDAGPVPYLAWLEEVLANRGTVGADEDLHWSQVFWRRHDIPAIAQTWAEIVGPERVHVIVLDKARPEILFDTFERLLDLDAGTLAGAPRNALLSNRSLSRAEAELVQAVNVQAMTATRLDRAGYYRVMRNGAVAAMLRDRVPEDDEGTVEASRELAERVAAEGARAARLLRASGAHLIGDVDVLATPSSTAPESPEPSLEAVDPDLPALAIAGAVSKASGQGVNFGGGRLDETATAARVRRRDVLAELARRVRPGRSR